jgi:hypothetical protein
MTFVGKPDKPAKLRGMGASCSIETPGTQTDSYGMYAPTSQTLVENIPCSLNQMSTAEAVQYGKDTDKTMYRLRLPIRSPDGVDIRLTHGQGVIVTSNTFPSGVRMVVIGRGAPQGQSGMQLLSVMEEDI